VPSEMTQLSGYAGYEQSHPFIPVSP
jgi:hypothetical protein